MCVKCGKLVHCEYKKKKKTPKTADKTKYIIINGNAPEGSLTADSFTLVEFTDEEYARYAEESWNRDEPPDLIIELSELLHVINNTEKPCTFDEYFGNDEDREEGW